MRRFAALLLILCATWFVHTPARASGDFGCATVWKLRHQGFTGCNNMVVLGPANDTRVNLTLLLFDRHGIPDIPPRQESSEGYIVPVQALFEWGSFRDTVFPWSANGESAFADGEGSRCRSNDSGAARFETAVKGTRKLKDSERQALVAARKAFKPNCAGSSSAAETMIATLTQVRTPSGKAFAAYLQGAALFYEGDFGGAAAQFNALRTSDEPWVREAASYMAGRVALNRAQVGAFDEYGYPRGSEKVDREVADAAESALLAYLRAYPKGVYAKSARGLLRRVYWLSGRTTELSAEYTKQIEGDVRQQTGSDVDLAEEIDNKLLGEAAIEKITDPVLLAVLDLQHMRQCSASGLESCPEKLLSRQQLEGQRGYFARAPKLFDYLLAAYAFYIDRNAGEVLRLIPDASHQIRFSYLEFSRQALRRMALEERADRNARPFWSDLLPGAQLPFQRLTVELALALNYERSGAIERLFQPESPVRTAAVREMLLIYSADADLLRRQAQATGVPPHEREVALFTLLYKELTRGRYADFLRDLALVPEGAPSGSDFYDLVASEHPPSAIFTTDTGTEKLGCPAVRAIALQLSRDPRNSRGQLCLAEFLRVKGFDQIPLDQRPPPDELGGAASRFAGRSYSRLELYKALISDPKVPSDDKAYALFRAVNCYAPNGNNSCGGTEVPVSQRKAWFFELKRIHASSPWAQELQYYW